MRVYIFDNVQSLYVLCVWERAPCVRGTLAAQAPTRLCLRRVHAWGLGSLRLGHEARARTHSCARAHDSGRPLSLSLAHQWQVTPNVESYTLPPCKCSGLPGVGWVGRGQGQAGVWVGATERRDLA